MVPFLRPKMKFGLKGLMALLLIPPTRAFVRYGPDGAVKRLLWNGVCRRLQGRPHRFAVRTRYGFRFAGNTADWISSHIYYFGVWEPVISQWVYSLRLRGRTIIDVGAHCGWYSLMGAQCVGAEGHVVAIEASPCTFSELSHNIALSGNDNVRLINVAAWNTASELRLFPGGRGDAGKTTVISKFADLAHTTKDVAANVTISAAPLSSLLLPREVATAALIKIDVEGAEPEVIEGLAPMLQYLPEDVRFIIEVNPETLNASNRTAGDFLRFFKDSGFRPYVIKNEYDTEFYLDARQHVFARPVAFEGDLTQPSDLVFSRLPL